MITFKRNSWHGWIIDKMTPFYSSSTKNICQLIRRLIFALVFTVPLALVGASFFTIFLLGGMLYTLAHDVSWLFGHTLQYFWIYNAGCVSAMNLIMLTCVGTLGFVFGYYWVKEKLDDAEEIGDIGPVRAYYKSVKNKVCALVRYE